jgi:hypothetical protein
MQKKSFVLGLLVGAVVATAWAQVSAQVPAAPGPDSSGLAAAINPIEMMTNTGSLPVENHDAI